MAFDVRDYIGLYDLTSIVPRTRGIPELMGQDKGAVTAIIEHRDVVSGAHCHQHFLIGKVGMHSEVGELFRF